MNPNLFKSAEFYQRRYQNFSTLLIVPLGALVLFLFLFSFLAKKEVSITAQGELVPTKVVSSIQSASNNLIVANFLTNGQIVKKGDILVLYDETVELSQKDALKSQLDSLLEEKNGLELLEASLRDGVSYFSTDNGFGHLATFNSFINQVHDIELGLSKTNTEVSNQIALTEETISAINQQITNLYQQIAEYEELRTAIINQNLYLSEGNPHQASLNAFHESYRNLPTAATIEQYVSQVNQTLTSLQSSIDSLAVQRAGTGAVATYDNSYSVKVETLRQEFLQTNAQSLKTVNQQITEINSQIVGASEQLNRHTIRADESGLIALNEEYLGQSYIPLGTEIAKLYPDLKKSKEVAISYYVDSDHVSLLEEGQAVRLTLEKIGNNSLTITGQVSTIAQTATKTEQGNFFEIKAVAELTEGEAEKLRYGLQGKVTSVLAKKSFFSYYIDKLFNRFN